MSEFSSATLSERSARRCIQSLTISCYLTVTWSCAQVKDAVTLGQVVLDLGPLFAGMSELHGWYNILDVHRRPRGQLKVSHVREHSETFREHLETFVEHLQTFVQHLETFVEQLETFVEHSETFVEHSETFVELSGNFQGAFSPSWGIWGTSSVPIRSSGIRRHPFGCP
jgi:hypothetical protein